MAQTRPRKFLFDRSFDDPNRLYLPGERRSAEIEAEAVALAMEQAAGTKMPAAAPAPPPVPTISPEEQLKAQLEAAREEGFVQGHTAALEEAETAREHYIADAMNIIASGIDKLGEQQSESYAQLANDSMRMVYAIVRKLLPPIAQSHAAETIGEFVRQVMPLAVSEPHLVVRAHSMITADLEERLKPLANRPGFRGTFNVVPDYELQPGDCRIEWDGGGAERNEARIWREIRDVMATTLGDIDIETIEREADVLPDDLVEAPPEPTPDDLTPG